MAKSPQWKVYDAGDVYQAATKELGAAIVLADWYGDGATVRAGHTIIVWRHGPDMLVEHGSYEAVEELVEQRLRAHHTG